MMKKVISLFCVAILVSGILFYDPYNEGKNDNRWVLRLGDREVDTHYFERELYHRINSIEEHFFSSGHSKTQYLNLFVNHLKNELINDIALEQIMQAMGININHEYIKNVVKKDVIFHDDVDKFDIEKFREILQINQTNEHDYYKIIESILLKKIVFNAIFSKNIEDSFLIDKYNTYFNHKRNVDIIKIVKPDFNEAPNNEELHTFYQNNTSTFLSEELRKISYISINPSDLKNIKANDGEINNEFHNNFNHYASKLRDFHFVNILFESEAEAENWHHLLKNDFSINIAKLTDNQKAKIKNFNNIRLSHMDKKLAKAIIQIGEDEVSDIIKTSLGYHIIKLNKINEPNNLNELVYNAIKDDVSYFKKNNEFKLLINKIHDLIDQGNDLDNVAKNNNLDIKQTGFFNKYDHDYEDINIKDFADIIFVSKINNISGLLTNHNSQNDDYFIFRVDDIIPESEREFDEIQELVKEHWLENKIHNIHADNANSIFIALQNGQKIENINNNFDFKIYNEQWTIQQNNNHHEKLDKIIFQLNKQNPISTPILIDDFYYIVHLKNISINKLSEYERKKQIEDINTQITNNWNNMIHEDLLNYARHKFKVKINQKYFAKFESL